MREKLGEDQERPGAVKKATDDFIKVIGEAGLDTRRDLATKEDLFRVELNLRGDIAKVEISLNENISKVREDVAKMSGEMVLLKWILGAVLAGIISLIVRAFFMH
ncbi:MAG: hypothetical protein HQL03_14160 [Nitrospirae bacterium]|nr:hypothetical protein [Nitrospirota bacterium]MBF0593149.1 hypothetical protein [Nitrospirota bacterium]